MGGWILLIPPSESKQSPKPGGKSYSDARKSRKLNAFDDLDPYRNVLLKTLEAVHERGIGLDQLYEVTGAALQEAIQWNQHILDAPTAPARDVYNGVMYQEINFTTLKAKERKLFDQNALILSGLFGLLRPTDTIPAYKMKIGANLGGAVGKLTHFWRRPVSEVLRHELRGKVVWDFLPDQHRRVWDGTGEVTARHQVKFVKRIIRSGVAEYKTISHHSKTLKGALIRHLLAKDGDSPKDLFDFVHKDGYRYNRELSVTSKRESVLVFAAD